MIIGPAQELRAQALSFLAVMGFKQAFSEIWDSFQNACFYVSWVGYVCGQ
jgi:hypothetical protein